MGEFLPLTANGKYVARYALPPRPATSSHCKLVRMCGQFFLAGGLPLNSNAASNAEEEPVQFWSSALGIR